MKKIFHGVSIFASLTLTSCGGASLSWPMPEATQVDSLRIFRQGDAMPREILAGVYPGDVARLELQGAPVGSTTLWTSSNPTMGEISTAGELRILSAGEFEILAQVASFTQRLRVRVSSERLDIEPELAEPTPNAVPQPSPEASPIPTRSPSPSPSPSPLPSPSPIASPSPQPSPAPDNSPPPAVASDPFIDELITFTPGAHAGFGANHLPDIVLGAPRGNGNASGGFHVLSLGVGGQVILKSATPILNELGPDFIVFENAFYAGGNSQAPFAEPATVAVSQDGIHFVAFDCDPKNSEELYPGCAGVHPVYANSETNDIDPTNPTQAGGDAFDLETVGLSWIQWIRLQDLSTSGGGTSAGFDLDAIAILHQ